MNDKDIKDIVITIGRVLLGICFASILNHSVTVNGEDMVVVFHYHGYKIIFYFLIMLNLVVNWVSFEIKSKEFESRIPEFPLPIIVTIILTVCAITLIDKNVNPPIVYILLTTSYLLQPINDAIIMASNKKRFMENSVIAKYVINNKFDTSIILFSLRMLVGLSLFSISVNYNKVIQASCLFAVNTISVIILLVGIMLSFYSLAVFVSSDK